MNGDYSWSHSAKEYMSLYKSLFEPKTDEAVSAGETEKQNPVVVDINA
jgi:starch synthase